MKTLVYISSCGMDAQGRPGSFFLQELPWLCAHFDRVLLCSHEGIAEITEPRPRQIHAKKPLWGRVSAVFRAFFQAAFWQELGHLRRDRSLTAVNDLKLFLFTVRGLTLQSWMEHFLRKNEEVTLYSFWMSYDGYAAALGKRRDPRRRAIARGHHFDINPAANPMELAAANITRFHTQQKRTGFMDAKENGVVVGQRVLPLRSVGLYVPGGTARYPSSVLMDAIPAKIAGVRSLVMTTPPDAHAQKRLWKGSCKFYGKVCLFTEML